MKHLLPKTQKYFTLSFFFFHISYDDFFVPAWKKILFSTWYEVFTASAQNFCGISFAKKHYSRHLLYHMVLPFNNPILLWSFWGREFLLNSMRIAKCFRLCILKFLPMIASYFDDGNSLFILKLLAKFFFVFSHASDFSIRNST